MDTGTMPQVAPIMVIVGLVLQVAFIAWIVAFPILILRKLSEIAELLKAK